MATSRNVVGAHVIVYINGFVYAQVTDLAWDSSTPAITRAGLDSLMAYELSPGPVKVSGRLSVLRLHSDGGLEARGIVAPFSHLPLERYFSILVVDRVTGKRLHQADHCKCTGQAWQLPSRGRVQGSFSFEGISWVNDAVYE